jgi:hypothetical protein
MRLAFANEFFALIGSGGRILQYPALALYRSQEDNTGLGVGIHIDVGLEGMASRMQLDPSCFARSILPLRTEL